VNELLGKDLERDLAAEIEIAGAIDHAHAATADFFEDLVVGERAADHRSVSATNQARARIRVTISGKDMKGMKRMKLMKGLRIVCGCPDVCGPGIGARRCPVTPPRPFMRFIRFTSFI
jgi:hypothetical protein